MAREETWEQREARRKFDRSVKERDLKELLKHLDEVMTRAEKNSAYHPQEMKRFDTARSSLYAIKAGYVDRRSR